MLLTLVVFVVILSVLVFAHEAGHFWTARKFKMRTEEFGFGLPPRIFGLQKTDRGWRWVGRKEKTETTQGDQTVYSLNWIPIGGFVKIKGEDGDFRNDPDSFGSRPIWQRFITLISGVTMNVILCAVLLAIGFALGMPSVIEENLKGAIISEPQIRILEVLPDLPAAQNGIKVGDVILSVNGQMVSRLDEVRGILNNRVGETFKVGIERDGKKIDKEIPAASYQGVVGFGVAIMETAIVRYPWYLAIWQGIKSTGIWLVTIILAFYNIIKNLIVGAPVGVEVAGPVGIAALTGQATRMGLVYVLQFAALLSLNLAVINALPLPALDGGRVLFLIIEKARRRAVKQKLENLVHNIGFILLMMLVVLITYHDLARYGGRIIGAIKTLVKF